MPTHTYSLWLVPDGAVHQALGRLIDELADQHGGPRFPPHITLLGSVVGSEEEVARGAERIAQQTHALTVDFDGLGAEEVYFRTLYLVARPAPALMAANALARQVFPPDRSEPFRPHLSLLYGDYAAETKRAISDAIQPRLPATCEVRALEVYLTEPPVEAWRLVRRCALAAGS